MRCRPTLTRVDALRTGELPDEEHRAVEEHLKTCKSCEESAADIEHLATAVKALALVPPRPISIKWITCGSHFRIARFG